MRKSLILLTCVLSTSVALSACGKKETTTSEVKNKAPKPLTELAQQNGENQENNSSMNNLPPGHPPLNGQLPPGHPTTTTQEKLAEVHSGKKLTKFDKPINIPLNVVKTWKYATVEIVDKTTGKVVKKEKVTKDTEIKYDDLDIKILYIVPHLILNQGYTSGSNEPINPALLVKVKSKGRVIYAGPIYKNFPNMYNINHPRYKMLLKGISKS